MNRKNCVTTVYEMFYTSTCAFLIFSILNYISATSSKETMQAGTENTTLADDFKILMPLTWFRGFEACNQMGSYYMAPSINKTDLISRVRNSLPLWTHAFEVKNETSGNVYRIQRSHASGLHNTFICVQNGGTSFMEMGHRKSYLDAAMYCADINCSLPYIYPNNVTRFHGDIWMNTSYWVSYLRESVFLNEHAKHGLSLKCFLLDKDGEIRTDHCSARHKTLCLRGNGSETQPVVQYVGQVSIAQYIPTTTNIRSSGRSSLFNKSSSTKTNSGTNNTKYSTVSSSPNSAKADPWMDPQIQYVGITVGSVIVLAIVVAICCCCCRKRGNADFRKSKSANLADVYSETADSIAMKEVSVYETPDISEYAIPEDAVRKAKQRQSIGENEYDVISKTNNKTPTQYIGNAYSHVAIVSSKDRRVSSDQDESAYDVTNFGKQHTVVLTPKDAVGNVYGQVEIKKES